MLDPSLINSLIFIVPYIHTPLCMYYKHWTCIEAIILWEQFTVRGQESFIVFKISNLIWVSRWKIHAPLYQNGCARLQQTKLTSRGKYDLIRSHFKCNKFFFASLSVLNPGSLQKPFFEIHRLKFDLFPHCKVYLLWVKAF